MKRILSLPALAATLLLAGCAGNPRPGGLDAGLCNTWDTGADGFIDRNEFGVGFNNVGVFNRWDASRSGFIEDNEFGIGVRGNTAFGAFNTWDTDRSLGLDVNEFGVGAFGMFDRDRNGMIDLNECRAGIGAF
jgi:Ca2+-binding EF-hand superfamily protein